MKNTTMNSMATGLISRIEAATTPEELASAVCASTIPTRLILDWMELKTDEEREDDFWLRPRQDRTELAANIVYGLCQRRFARPQSVAAFAAQLWDRGNLPAITKQTLLSIVEEANANGGRGAGQWHPETEGNYGPAEAWGPIPGLFVYAGSSPSYSDKHIWVDNPQKRVQEPSYVRTW